MSKAEITPVTLALAWQMFDGGNVFALPATRDRAALRIVDILPIECRTGRTMFWVAASDGTWRIMDCSVTVCCARRLSDVA